MLVSDTATDTDMMALQANLAPGMLHFKNIYGAVHLEPAYFVQNFLTCKINPEFISFSGNAPFDERNSSSEQFF